MKWVLCSTSSPLQVDYTDPVLPPRMTAEKVRAGINFMVADIAEPGWLAETCLISPDATAVPTVERKLVGSRAIVVIGTGVRQPPNRLMLFESVSNAIHRAAPQSIVAFNALPEDSGQPPRVGLRMEALWSCGLAPLARGAQCP
jgi:hypothetical protein